MKTSVLGDTSYQEHSSSMPAISDLDIVAAHNSVWIEGQALLYTIWLLGLEVADCSCMNIRICSTFTL